jgi:ribosome-associated heat shock protein Hsp15
VEVRLDTYLWAIRMFKSRTLASSAIKGNKVKLKEKPVKPSHVVTVGETYTITIDSDHKKIIEVAVLIEKRGSYEKVKHCYLDHSPPIVKQEKLESMFYKTNVKNDKGAGRPTKKNRRDLKKKGGWF